MEKCEECGEAKAVEVVMDECFVKFNLCRECAETWYIVVNCVGGVDVVRRPRM